MTKSERLLNLLQLLHQHHLPVKAAALAETLNVSQRTVYRDIETLRLQGADIIGEAGIGYVLNDGYLLPPLMFSVEEIEALILGSQWVKNHADEQLVQQAKQAMSKIEAVIPKSLHGSIKDNTLFTPLMSNNHFPAQMANNACLIRQAIRDEKQTSIQYADGEGQQSQRLIYPFALAFFDNIQVIAAWCTLRREFRHFRVDRITHITVNTTHYQPAKKILLRQWKKEQNIPDDD